MNVEGMNLYEFRRDPFEFTRDELIRIEKGYM